MSEYKRLTKRVFDKVQGCEDKMTIHGQSLYDLYNRLAELEDKIENGTLIELPCKVGEKVYCVYHFDDSYDEDFEYEIIPEEVVDIIVKEDDFDIRTACRMIGKFQIVCVCLTKSEAEARIKELREKNNG